ncbi:7-cyano-7-deazaguanine synthase QueC [Planctomicrobium sp. SH527]|uniref:7-cyano-7-deazaguanine synthase QueC n=1 Tax=Planctomicrobium sp. SH527 TaxID=3448123 RepID=UPI003F5C6540
MNASSVSPRRAVVLVSGGLDSATALAYAREDGFECYALTFDYGQRHRCELEAARRISQSFGVKAQSVLSLDLRQFGGSALTSEIDVPKDRVEHAEDPVPITYVPARNTVFLSIALAWAEVLGAFDIYIGVNAVDYSGYPDCRPEFIEQFERLANLATKAGVESDDQFRIHTPLIHLKKSEIISEGTRMGVDYGLTHSCYDPTPEGESCGRCDSCRLRVQGFTEAGLTDPVKYAIG